MTPRRLSDKRLSVIRRLLPRRYFTGEVEARMIQELDALRAERDTLAYALLNHGVPDVYEEAFELSERVLGCRICRGCGDELDWNTCIYCDPEYERRNPDDHFNLSLGVTCGVCNGTRGEWEPCERCAKAPAVST